MKLSELNLQYVDEAFDADGMLCKFQPKPTPDYNFAYDVVDKIAELAPDHKALVWCDDNENERVFTFDDLSKLSSQAANMFVSYGVKKGDMVLCVLKRHWQIWVTILALEKIGAVLIPATNQLMPKDFVYRFKSGDVKFTVATSDGEVLAHIDESENDYKGLQKKFSVKGSRDGWVDFDNELSKFPETFKRAETKVEEPLLAFFSSGTTGYPKMVIHDHTYSLAHLISAKHWL
jgi:acetyl-CoA synthetase